MTTHLRKTYRKKKEWISRLNFCLASVNLTTLIESFSVVQDDKLPSDHAIIACSIKHGCNLEYEQTSIRAKNLLAYELAQKNETEVI